MPPLVPIHHASNHRLQLSLFGALLGLLALSGCGGGGGGSSRPPIPPVTPPTNQAPTASFTMSQTSGPAPLLITVDGTGSSDSDGTITGYTWNFNDANGSAIGATAQHTYTTAGSYTLTLTVTDDDGRTASTSRALTVSGGGGSASVSGEISILSSSAIDADVNDRLTVAGNNNDFDNAQLISNPVTLGGFANLANTGESTGNLFASGDPGDFYRVNFSGNEVILLTIAESDADLDLRLYDANRVLINSSVGVTKTESIPVTLPGDYFIEVLPFAGASNYVLNIGQNLSNNSVSQSAGAAANVFYAALANRSVSRLSDDFIPGELILLDRKPTRGQVMRSSSTARAAADGLNLVRSGGPVALATLSIASGSKSSQVRVSRQTGTQASGQSEGFPTGATVPAALAAKYATLMRMKQFNRDADQTGLLAEVNVVRRAHQTPDDSFYGSQWHYQNINLPSAWDTTVGSSNVIVAVVDTGVLLNHPDLAGQLVSGYDFIRDITRANDGDGLDNNPDDPGDRAFGASSSFHGTHVAGTVAARSNNTIGVAGVAWNTKIMPLRALGVDGGSSFDMLQSMRFAAGLSNDSGTTPAQAADIINLSLGSEFSSTSEQDTVNAIRDAGIFIVASAGNESTDLPRYPAAYDGVISVSATTISNTLAGYSNTGPTIDIAAPGGNTSTDQNGDGIGDGVVSTMGDDGGAGPVQFGYTTLNGTSMAAPHVSGVIALMKAVHPTLTPAQFDNALFSGDLTDDFGPTGRDDQFGWGMINAQRAVVVAQSIASGGTSDPGPILSASPSNLNFGPFGTTGEWTLQNIGTGSITINNVSVSEPWLTFDASLADASGLGTYNLTVNRTGLADGSYSAEVVADSTTNAVSLRVIMQVATTSPNANAGLHFVIVTDQDGNSDVPAAVVNVQNGTYRYIINNVPFGEYQIFGGTDSDDDNFLCDSGEACGAYPTLDSPTTIQVNGNQSGLNFVSDFRSNLGTLSTTADEGAEEEPAKNEGIRIVKPELLNTQDTFDD